MAGIEWLTRCTALADGMVCMSTEAEENDGARLDIVRMVL